MPAIFISHSSRDQKAADDIKAALAKLGFERIFLDFDKESGIGAGENWERRLHDELSRCHAVILVLTPNWLASKWCFAELVQARSLGKIILPVICEPLGTQKVLAEIQSVDLLDWNEEGLVRLKQSLEAIKDELARGFSLPPNRPPYPGIHAFEIEDAAIYFGRDAEARAVIERLDARRTQGGARLLVVIGASGSGKSSLLKAGVLRQLMRRQREWLLLPVIRPERAPIESLSKAIAQQLGKADGWREWYRILNASSAISFIEELVKDLRVGDSRNATVLLPIDQLEEVFTIASSQERASFLRLITNALDPRGGIPLMVIATGRSDVLEGLVNAGELTNLSETYPLPPMPLDRVPRLVEGPAAVASLSVEKGLAERIAHDVETSEALPLLAHTLSLLYQRGVAQKKLSLTEYEALGDSRRRLNPVQNSVRLVADRAIGDLTPSQQDLEALRDAFVPHLVRVRLEDGKRVRQAARLSELPQQSLGLITALIKARLITSEGDVDGIVEVAHEALFYAWPLLDEWLTEEHNFLINLDRIRIAMEIWKEAREDPTAFLRGILLVLGRTFLHKYPARFASGELVQIASFIRASVAAEDAEQARANAREKRAQRLKRTLAYFASAAAVTFAALAGFAAVKYFESEGLRQEAQRTASLFLADQAKHNNAQFDYRRGALLALRALPIKLSSPDKPLVPEAEDALANAATNLGLSPSSLILNDQPSISALAATSADGSTIAFSVTGGTGKIVNARSGQTKSLPTSDDTVLKISPDGQLILTSGSEGRPNVWDARSGNWLGTLPVTGAKDGLFAANGKTIAILSVGRVTIFDSEARTSIKSFETDPDDERIALSPDGTSIALYSSNAPRVSVYGMEGNKLWSHDAPLKAVYVASFSMDSELVFLGGEPGGVIFDARNGAQLGRLDQGIITDFALHPHGKWLTAIGTGTVTAWDLTTRAMVAQVQGSVAAFVGEDEVRVARSSTTNGSGLTMTHVASIHLNAPEKQEQILMSWSDRGLPAEFGFADGGNKLWAMETNRTIKLLDVGPRPGHTLFAEGIIDKIEWSPDGSQLLASYIQEPPRIWSFHAPFDFQVIPGYPTKPTAVAFSPSANKIALGRSDGPIEIWNTSPLAKEGMLPVGESRTIETLKFSDDGASLLTAGSEIGLQLWPISGARPRFTERLGGITGAAFNSDASLIAIGINYGQVTIIDGRTGQETASARGTSAPARLVFGPKDAQYLLVGYEDGTARLLASDSAKLLAELGHYPNSISDVAISPDGSEAAIAAGNQVTLWSLPDAKARPLSEARLGSIKSVAYSVDGRFLAACGDQLKIWDRNTGREIVTIDRLCTKIAFHPTEPQILAFARQDGSIDVVPIMAGQEAMDFIGSLDLIPLGSDEGTD